MEGWMKQDIDTALALLTEAFPQTFVLEKYRPHRPLKVGIAADIRARCPELERRALSVALNAYARRVMYLQSLAIGAEGASRRGRRNPGGSCRLLEIAPALGQVRLATGVFLFWPVKRGYP